MNEKVAYDSFAKIYDVWVDTAPICEANLPFYVEEYLNTDGLVVELGIGQGRIAIPAARQGKSITGVDYSEGMLSRCRQKAEEAGVADKLTLIQGDMKTFELSQPADLITIPFHSIGHLVTMEEKKTALAQIFKQLKPGGRFVFDHFIFNREMAIKNSGLPFLRAEYTDPNSGRDCLLWVCTRHEIKNQKMRIISWTSEIDDQDVEVRRQYHRFDFGWFEPEQMRQLLSEVGFEEETLYGHFDRRPFTSDSPEQIWIVKRPN